MSLPGTVRARARYLSLLATAKERLQYEAFRAPPSMASTNAPHLDLSRGAHSRTPYRLYSSRSTSAAEHSKRSRTKGDSDMLAKIPTPKAMAAYLDEYVIGQAKAKRSLAVGVYNHYMRLAMLRQRRASRIIDEEEKVLDDSLKQNRPSFPKDLVRSPDEDAILSDYVGQTSGSKRWTANRATDEESVRMTGNSQLSSMQFPSTYFSSKWPASSGPTPNQSGPMHDAKASQARRNRAVLDHEAHFDKANMIMIGPSGSGKTHLIRTLATSLSVPFVHADATPLTSAGYVGEDVESIVGRLLEAANWNVEKAERGIICIDEIDKLAAPSSPSSGAKTTGRDVGGTGVQQALLKILEGTTLTFPDKRTVEPNQARQPKQMANKPWWSPEMQALHAEQNTNANKHPSHATALDTIRKDETTSSNGSDGSGSIKVNTSNILFVLCGAFVGLEDIIAARNPTSSLHAVEAEDLTKYGFIPEFVGRLPVFITLDHLTKVDLVRILTEPRNALVTQYQNLFSLFSVKLHFTRPALDAIAQQATKVSGASSGARSLKRLLETRLLDTMYEVPGGGVRYALVDRDAAMGQGDVQLFSRGGRSAWVNAIEEDEEKHSPSKPGPAPSTSSTKPPGPSDKLSEVRNTVITHPSVGPNKASPSGLFTRVDEATLRRRARARLTRPSRVGNLRILTTES